MSDGKGNAKNSTRIVKITPRKARSKRRAALWNQGRREKPEAIALRGKTQNLSNKKAVRRTTERPEFKTGNPRSFLDQIAKELEANRFGYIAEPLEKKSYLDRGDFTEGERIEKSLCDLITERAIALAREKDGKHFVACVSYLNEYVRGSDFPKELVPDVTDAIKDYAVELFADNDYSPEDIHDKLEKFFTLGMFDSEAVSESPKIQESIGKRLIAYFEKRNFTDFGELLFVCGVLKIAYVPQNQTLNLLQEQALSWLKEAFENTEKDPRDALILLSQFMEKFENMGVELSAKQIRERPDLLSKVQSALAAIQSSEELDEGSDIIIKEIRGTFSSNSWRRIFW